MDIFTQQLVNGLVLGSIYALVALGYTMVYGILELINFAHGEVTMIGAMVALTVIGVLVVRVPDLPGHSGRLAGILVAIPACMLLAFGIEKIAYRPLAQSAATGAADHRHRRIHHSAESGDADLGPPVRVLPGDILPGPRNMNSLAPTSACCRSASSCWRCDHGGPLAAGRAYRLGRAMRATAQSKEVAELMGVNVDRVISATFIIGAAIAAIGRRDGQRLLRPGALLHGLHARL
jgi:branched-chain amino acid transport system permease protein